MRSRAESLAPLSWSPRILNVAAVTASRSSSRVGIICIDRAAIANVNADDPAISVRSRSKKAALGPFVADTYAVMSPRVPTGRGVPPCRSGTGRPQDPERSGAAVAPRDSTAPASLQRYRQGVHVLLREIERRGDGSDRVALAAARLDLGAQGRPYGVVVGGASLGRLTGEDDHVLAAG